MSTVHCFSSAGRRRTRDVQDTEHWAFGHFDRASRHRTLWCHETRGDRKLASTVPEIARLALSPDIRGLAESVDALLGRPERVEIPGADGSDVAADLLDVPIPPGNF